MPTRSRLFPALALLLSPYGVFAQADAPVATPQHAETPVTETTRSVLPTLKLPDIQDLKLPMPRTVRAANAVLGMARQRLALVIGNPNVGPEVVLGAAARDTQAVAAGLRAAGFVVMVREDLSADAMRANLKEFRERLQPGGVGFLYYTGVGAQVDGKNYVVPRGLQLDPARAEAQIQHEALPLQDMVDAVQGTAESPRYLVVDAGFTHPALAHLSKPGFTAQKMPLGTMALFATAPDVAIAPPEAAALPMPAPTDPRLMAASPFGRELVRSLVTPRISGAEVMRLTRGAMLDITHGQQAPWIEGDSRDKDEFAEPNLLDALLPRSPEEMAREALKQALRVATSKGGGEVPVSEIIGNTPPNLAPTSATQDDWTKSSKHTADTPNASLPDGTLSSAAGTAASTVASAATAAAGAAATAATVAAIAGSAAAGQATTAAGAASTVAGLAGSVASMALGSNGGRGNAATEASPSRMLKPASLTSGAAPAPTTTTVSAAPAAAPANAPTAKTAAAGLEPTSPAPPATAVAEPGAPPSAAAGTPAVSPPNPSAVTAAPAMAGDLPVSTVMANLAAQSAAQLASQLPKAPPPGAAENRTQPQQSGGERPAYLPRVNPFGYAEGDTFTYRITDTWKNQVIGSSVQSIEQVLPDGQLVGNEGQTRMDPQGRIQSTRYADGSQSQFEPCQDLWWSNPKRGESRKVDFDEFFQRADRSRGQTEWKGSLSVGRPRKIQLPAGEFVVVPIEGSGWYYEKYANGTRSSGQWSRTVWYSTQLGHPVAIDIEDANNLGKLLRRERIELVHAQSARAPQ